MKDILGDQVVAIFLSVNDMGILANRLRLDSRDINEERLIAGVDELASFFQGAFDNVIDYKVMNDGTDPNVIKLKKIIRLVSCS